MSKKAKSISKSEIDADADANITESKDMLTGDLPILQHLHNITDFPKPTSHASGHCRGNLKRRVNAAEIVIHVVERDRKSVVLDFL